MTPTEILGKGYLLTEVMETKKAIKEKNLDLIDLMALKIDEYKGDLATILSPIRAYGEQIILA